MKKLFAALAIAALAVTPFVASAHGDEADLTVPLGDVPEAGQGSLYVDVETTGVWQESNGDAGLQTEAHEHGEGDEAVTILADTRVI